MDSRTAHFQIGTASLEHLDRVANLRATADMHLALMRHTNSIGFSDVGDQHREQMSFHAKLAGSAKHNYTASRTGEFDAAVDPRRDMAKLKPGVGKYQRN